MRKVHQKLFWLTILLLPAQIGRHFWPQDAYIFGLRIDYLSPTVYLTDILICGTLFFWFASLSWKSIKGLINLRLFFIILVFLLLNVVIAQNNVAAIYKLVKVAEFSLFGLYVAKNKINLERYVLPLSISIVATLVIALLQFQRQSSLGGAWWFLGERNFNSFTPGIATAIIDNQLVMRPYATFPHPNALAGFALVVSILLAGFILKNKNGLFTKGAIIVSGLILILISFSRTAWFAVLVALTIYLLQKAKGINKKIYLVIILMIITFLLVDFTLPFSGHEAFEQRKMLLDSAWQMIKSHPLLGVGLNNFIPVHADRLLSNSQVYWLQPVHNIFFLTAAETGLVGLTAFLFFLIKSFHSSLRSKNIFLVIALFVIAVTGLTDHYWLTLQQNQLLFALVLGLCWC